MENLACGEVLDNHYKTLQEMSSSINSKIEEQMAIVYDEFNSYIESLVYGNANFPILNFEARFDYALANLKSMVWQREYDEAMSETLDN